MINKSIPFNLQTSAYKFGTLASSGFENYFKISEELHKVYLWRNLKLNQMMKECKFITKMPYKEIS